MIRAIVLIILLLLAWAALAEPPAGVDPDSPTAHWFRSLQLPGGHSCCSLADCRAVSARWQDDHWQAFIDQQSFGERAPNDWRDVDPEAMLDRPDNPISRPVACWVANRVACFVMPPTD